MNKFFKTIFVLAFVALSAIAFSVSAKSGAVIESSAAAVSAAAAAAISPKSLYVSNCARCHGADGKSQTELGQTLDATDLTAKKTSVSRNVQVITKGLGGMPGFGQKLKKADITAIANYIRSL